ADILDFCLNDPAWQVSVAAAAYAGERGRDHLIKLLQKAPGEGRIAAVKALAEFKDRVCRTALKNHFLHTNSHDLKLEILKTFRKNGDASLNDFLLDLISHPDTGIVVSAVKALGSCGMLSSVKHLHSLMNSPQQFPRVKAVAKKAIAEIHARLAQGNEAGRLSVSEREARQGSLSIAQNTKPNVASTGTRNPQKSKRRKIPEI
ncbi:MAG: HEAT repeat domain-containing protein, partial [Spirochaetia bacterium]